jgi:hypothetical protein
MTLKDIFNSAINFDLMNIVYIFGGIILYLSPIGILWLGGSLLKNVLIDEQPPDRDLFAKIFMSISGTFSICLSIFMTYHLYFK